MNNPDFVSRLNHLYDTERQAIFDGMLGDLNAIAATKTRMLNQIAGLNIPPDVLAPLIDKAKRNQDLLGAVVRGVRMVNNRFNAARQHTLPLNTYDKSGKKTALNNKARALEWRA